MDDWSDTAKQTGGQGALLKSLKKDNRRTNTRATTSENTVAVMIESAPKPLNRLELTEAQAASEQTSTTTRRRRSVRTTAATSSQIDQASNVELEEQIVTRQRASRAVKSSSDDVAQSTKRSTRNAAKNSGVEQLEEMDSKRTPSTRSTNKRSASVEPEVAASVTRKRTKRSATPIADHQSTNLQSTAISPRQTRSRTRKN
ncbi:hypothetical protein K493DRAFT_301523 [Basidiobolus meristosporus CBS 931.73]|uniref:Uncharacterized protein n=1 Tax=Basidiobolus meristosporus CBS 931.73 TaxID=1314790 RepID=A0A1Y1YBJ7_9FUNG|nr:hypothetical protein K493DRAFT_301523 [Basidiobolus meristosporus CBS 931.73]|eukprot:ORX95322.1 hypothetical protein K493DRAFT_301523 [Basidiobolus meristosporus CBS 931.73]